MRPSPRNPARFQLRLFRAFLVCLSAILSWSVPAETGAHPPGYGYYGPQRGHGHPQDTAAQDLLLGEVTSLPISAKMIYTRRGYLYYVNGVYYRRVFRNQQSIYIPLGVSQYVRQPSANGPVIPFDARSHQNQVQSLVIKQRVPARQSEPAVIIILVPVQDSSGNVTGHQQLLVSVP